MLGYTVLLTSFIPSSKQSLLAHSVVQVGSFGPQGYESKCVLVKTRRPITVRRLSPTHRPFGQSLLSARWIVGYFKSKYSTFFPSFPRNISLALYISHRQKLLQSTCNQTPNFYYSSNTVGGNRRNNDRKGELH